MLDESAFAGSRLCVVGNICRDIKTAPIRAGDHLFRDGETSTDFIIETIGGGGANSALMARGLGAAVRFSGKIGADGLGSQLEAELVRHGIRSFLRRDRNVATGSSVALAFDSGSRHFISHQPNNYALDSSDIDLAMLDGDEHMLRADVWFSKSMLFGGNAKLLGAARDRGLKTSLDVNWDPHWGVSTDEVIRRRKESVRQVLPLVDMVHGNVRELNLFADSDDLALTLRRLTGWGADAVVIHMGSNGAGYFHDGILTTEPCVPVSKHTNTAGSGDLLSVCMMLLNRRRDIPIPDKLRLANRIVAAYIEGKRMLLPPL